MAMKDFDFKQFLLQKGERVGLYAAGAIALLMIVLSLFLPGKGLFSASPRTSANEIASAAKDKRQQVASAAPDSATAEQLRKVDPQLQKQASSVPEDPAGFRLFAEYFAPRDVPSSKRSTPRIFTPEEFQVAVVPAQVSTYMTLQMPDGTLKFGILTASNKGIKQKLSPDPFKSMQGFYGAGGMKGGGTGGGGMGAGGFPGAPPGYNAGTRGSASSAFGPPGGDGKPGGTAFGGAGKEGVEVKYVSESELGTIGDGSFARDMMPLRMALISGAFPFKSQVLEFQKVLHLETPAQVFGESVVEKVRGTDMQLSGFRFKGFEVERRAFGPDGKLIASPDRPDGWQPLDLQGPNSPYIQVVLQTLKEFAPEDPRLMPLLYPGLYMQRPVQVANKPYPNFEGKLPKIEETLKDLDAQVVKPPPYKNPKRDLEGFDPFGGADTSGMAAPDPSALATNQEWVPPGYAVLRFIDVTIQPGQSYEYRMRVKMANPNYKKPAAELAFPEVATPTELKSEPVEVKGPDGKPLRVTCPPDLYYYAVDEQALKKNARDYKGMNAGKSHDSGRQAVIQAQQWMSMYRLPGGKTEFFPVGDWVIGERMFVWRGEYLGQKERVHLPIWSQEQNAFILAGRPPRSGADRRPTEEVSFGAESGRAPLLVDFENGPGSMTYKRPAAPAPKTEEGLPVPGGKATPAVDIRAAAATEVLLLMPDGKLLARNSVLDAEDEERKEREESFTERVKEAETGKPAEAAKPGGPFDRGS
jgi:hypothetical protein